MKIEEYIQQHFLKRLEQHPVLVIYDSDRRYRPLLPMLGGPGTTIVDASLSTIRSREEAMKAWIGLGRQSEKALRLVVYLPIARPAGDEEKRADPFQIFSLGGGLFPREDGESYQALCQRAAPDKASRIDALFAAGTPDFDVINGLLEEGATWPKLKSTLRCSSAAEILVGLLCPDAAQKKALERDRAWVPEFCEFLRTTLSYRFPDGRDADAETVRAEVARLVLFSEFVFDLPQALPAQLSSVPRAAATARDLVYQVCDTLRGTEAYQTGYMELAGKAAAELALEGYFREAEDFGKRDTFAFEERKYLELFTHRTEAGDFTGAKTICRGREQSIWVRHTDRQQLWSIAGRLRDLLELAGDLETRLAACKPALAALFEFYCAEFLKLDTAHREFEQAVSDAFGDLAGLERLVEEARRRYLALAETLHRRFMEAVGREGWPVSGRPRNTDTFRRFVAPQLEERKRTALFMVDSLRYELAVALEKHLSQQFRTQTTAVCAQLPTVTAVGMAALLPDADAEFSIGIEKDSLVPSIKGTRITTPDERLKWFKSSLGDLCHMCDLDEIINKSPSRLKIPETTRLLIVKSGEIDQLCENTPGEAWRLMPKLVRKLLAGVRRVCERGFQKAVMATDHGFFLAEAQERGDVAVKPPGEWCIAKDRCLLGRGSPAAGVSVFPLAELGMHGAFDTYATPSTLATFAKGAGYFHSGLSLQECVLPVIEIDLAGAAAKEQAYQKPELKLSYRGGAVKRITTRRPMIEVALLQGMMFTDEAVRFQLSAWSGKELVGDAATCNHLDPSTGLLSIAYGESIRVPFHMKEEFSGPFEIRAVDPVTGVTFARLSLETDYAE